MFFLASRVPILRASSQYVLMLDKTTCWNCSDPSGCRDEVVAADQAVEAVNWTINRVAQLGLIENNSVSVEIRDTCRQERIASWELITTLGRLFRDKRINMTSLPHVLLASQLNPGLEKEVDNLHMESTVISTTSSHGLIQAAGHLIHRIGWKQVAILANPSFVEQLGAELAKEEICVVDKENLPNGRASKDEYTALLSGMTEFGVDKVIVAGVGKDIARLVRNMYELNLSLSLVLIPFDGPVRDMPGSDFEIIDLIQLIPTYYEMPEFMSEYKAENPSLVYEHPLTLQLVKTLYGLTVLEDKNVNEATTREGLKLTRETPMFRIEQMNVHSAQWYSIGMYEEGGINWNNSSQWNHPHLVSDGCDWCECLNGGWRGDPSWRWETWVTALTTVSGLGTLCAITVLIFLCTQCGHVLEGGQSTTVVLLFATIFLYLTLLPFCFQPGDLVCAFRAISPAATYTIVVSIMLSRSFLLATADSDGLPGHASGCLQMILFVLMLCVEGGVLLEGALTRRDPYIDTKKLGRVGVLVCSERGWSWLSNLIWPGILLCLQTSLSPFIWRSRRNYKEGVLFSLASLCCCLIAGAWVAVYLLCSELYGTHWEDIAVCAGLVSTATIILLVVFIPKVYLMTVWGVSKEVSMHMPGTATSTLHTDTIDYVRGTDIYKLVSDAQDSIMYENHPGNRRGLPNILSQAGVTYASSYSGTPPTASPGLPLGVVGLPGLSGAQSNSTYKLDSNTEPDHNISWEPFTGTGSRNTPSINGFPGVSSMFISNMQGYGYHSPQQPPDMSQSLTKTPSTKL